MSTEPAGSAPPGSAPAGSAPALRRLEVAAALRQHRKAARVTTAEVTQRLGFSYSKLSRLETGDRRIRPEDLERLCDLYGIDPDERQRLVTLADESRQASQWQELDTFERETVEFAQLEGAAYRIDDYKTSIITGLLQTPAYTRALFERLNSHIPSDALDARVAARRVRIDAMFNRVPLPTLNFVFDEATVRRVVGDRSVMREQVQHLIDLSARPEISIRMLPFSAGAHVGMDSLFAILSFHEQVRDRVYVDGFAPPRYLTDVNELKRYRTAFVQLGEQALDRSDSQAFLHAVVDDLATEG